MCCVFSGYHGVVSHVKLNHDSFAIEDQKLNLSIKSSQKTWSVFAEAFSATARDFGIATPKFPLVAMISWHLNYKGLRCTEVHNGTYELLDLSYDLLVLALSHTQDLDQGAEVLVIDPFEGEVHVHNSGDNSSDGFSQAGEDFIILSDDHTQVGPTPMHPMT